MSDTMFMVRGTISTLYVTDGTVNLLQGMQGKMLAAGMGAIVEGMAGSVANASMVAMYDGEFAQHFACYLNDRMVIGTFENVGFEDGDEVQAVVSELDNKTLLAHAVVRKKDNLLWLPFSVSKGRGGIARWIAILMFSIQFSGLVFLFLVGLVTKDTNRNLDSLIGLAPTLIFVGGGIGFLTYRSSIDDGIYAESIFRILGFKSPWRVNISPFSQARLGTGASYQVYHLHKALRAYKSLV